MGLKSLLLCSDEKIVRVLRRVLGDLDIELQVCADADSALYRLTRRRFEGIIVDCAAEGASQVLRSARSAPCNKQAVAVAIVEPAVGLRQVFALGAHFVLYKPVSSERAKSSFRAARALMKRERRRNSRVAIQVPVALKNDRTGFMQTVPTSDISEGGMAVQFPKQQKDPGPWQVHFTLPGRKTAIEVIGEVAWQNPGGHIGIRFTNLEVDLSHELRQWLNQQSPESEKDDPPVRCKLTDLSLGGCYLEVASPFPPRTRIVLSMRAGGLELRVEGVVRVMHPEVGMGVEFTQSTTEQHTHVEKFIQTLMKAGDVLPDLLVEPEGLESATAAKTAPAKDADIDDPLLELFQTKSALTTELFLNELRKQRRNHHPDTAEETILPV